MQGTWPKSACVSRITFNEVTRKAVLQAMANPRTVSIELVDAYRARVALDFLLGFNLSPLLWRKLPCALSAGQYYMLLPMLMLMLMSMLPLMRTSNCSC